MVVNGRGRGQENKKGRQETARDEGRTICGVEWRGTGKTTLWLEWRVVTSCNEVVKAPTEPDNVWTMLSSNYS